MSKQLRILTYWALLLTACDGDPVNPVQLSGGTTAGGSTSATGGASTSGPGVTTGSTLALGGGPSSVSTGGSPKGGATGGGVSATGGSGTGASTIGGSNAGSVVVSGECEIKPTADTGWVDGAKNACAIQGAWYAYNDCDSSPGDCTLNQSPTPKNPIGFPNESGKMCTSGTTVPINDDYTHKWGAGIALNLNQPATPANNDIKNPISDLQYALLGFKFHLSGTVPNPLRVIFPTTTTTARTAHFKEIATGAGDYQVLFTDAAQGTWIPVAERVALVTGDVVEIQFQVVGQNSANVPFNFCVEGLTALY